ncbi:ASCH domain-containing protein [Pelosinus baikalensis]|uniref:RNA-binding protein n=1 Tax=Pelosinus baikalensis TaxID=2892015 RepID=A0ABS8HX90_9FIRM|nr:ASCH domain-containing protein [Pelosinus baikalensis]MCC5467779.1 RNA-binding protein [Pelosinus baikalensis]
MFALNFLSPHNEKLLMNRKKNVTIRLGDIRDTYPENSVVWLTVGKKNSAKRRIYTAIIDKAITKKFSELTTQDLSQQNPDIKTVEELINFFEIIYEKTIHIEDTVTVIYFSEIIKE